MTEFKNAPLDFFGRAVTLFIGCITLSIIFISLFYEVPQMYGLASVLALVLVTGASFIPKIYIENKVLTIRNLFSKTEIPLLEIDKVEESQDSYAIRSFGIGGVFGYYGRFNGNEKWFVTNRDFLIKFKTKTGKIYAVSPKNKSQFLMDIKHQNIKLN